MAPVWIACCLWVVAASVVAMLPVRTQYVPGVPLLIAVPVLLFWLGLSEGAIPAAVATLGVASMFRRPLGYLFLRARGAA